MDRLHPYTLLKKTVTKPYFRNKGFRVHARIHASVLYNFSSERTCRVPSRSIKRHVFAVRRDRNSRKPTDNFVSKFRIRFLPYLRPDNERPLCCSALRIREQKFPSFCWAQVIETE